MHFFAKHRIKLPFRMWLVEPKVAEYRMILVGKLLLNLLEISWATVARALVVSYGTWAADRDTDIRHPNQRTGREPSVQSRCWS